MYNICINNESYILSCGVKDKVDVIVTITIIIIIIIMLLEQEQKMNEKIQT